MRPHHGRGRRFQYKCAPALVMAARAVIAFGGRPPRQSQSGGRSWLRPEAADGAARSPGTAVGNLCALGAASRNRLALLRHGKVMADAWLPKGQPLRMQAAGRRPDFRGT